MSTGIECDIISGIGLAGVCCIRAVLLLDNLVIAKVVILRGIFSSGFEDSYLFWFDRLKRKVLNGCSYARIHVKFCSLALARIAHHSSICPPVWLPEDQN